MNGLLRASLRNPYAVTAVALTIVVFGLVVAAIDPDRYSAGFQKSRRAGADVLQRHAGRHVEKDISNRIERGTGQAAGTIRQESRSIIGASIVRNYYRSDVDPNGASDAGQFAGVAAAPDLAAGHAAAGDSAVRSDQHRAGLHRGAG